MYLAYKLPVKKYRQNRSKEKELEVQTKNYSSKISRRNWIVGRGRGGTLIHGAHWYSIYISKPINATQSGTSLECSRAFTRMTVVTPFAASLPLDLNGH